MKFLPIVQKILGNLGPTSLNNNLIKILSISWFELYKLNINYKFALMFD
jgi:hypothetical protein